jgi:hypothetical protein
MLAHAAPRQADFAVLSRSAFEHVSHLRFPSSQLAGAVCSSVRCLAAFSPLLAIRFSAFRFALPSLNSSFCARTILDR